MTDFHTIRLNGPDYLLFLKAKTFLIEQLEEDLQNNDVFHHIITHFMKLEELRSSIAKIPNIEEE